MRVAALLVALGGCAAQLSQDHATGPDGVIEGATKLTVVDGVARAAGTVSYPYGDRVDWFVVELLEPGDVRVALRWRPLRSERAHLALELWNDDHELVATSKGRRRRRVELETLGLRLPRNKLYVRIYARDRSDAGSYELAVYPVQRRGVDWLAVEIPDPPRLPAVPVDEPPVPPTPPVPCPSPPDPRIKSCYERRPRTPMCEGGSCVVAETFVGTVASVHATNGQTVVTVATPTIRGIQPTWRAQFFDATTMHLVPNGTITILRVTPHGLAGTTSLTPAQLTNVRVLISPP